MKITIDIGGTNTRIAKFENENNKEVVKFDTRQVFEEEIKEIVKVINNFKGNEEVEGIGISAPGPLDAKNGIFHWVPNLQQWEGKNIVKILKEKVGAKKVVLNKDANLMALAYHNTFNNKDGITLFFTVSTGLGGGLIINNEIYSGFEGYAFEVDNAPVAFSKERGKDLTEGSLEYFSSGSGIAARSGLTTKEAFEQYDTNEKVKRIIDEGIETLANMIATSVSILNPSLLVIDGPVARYNTWYVEKAFEIAKTRMFEVQYRNLKFEIGNLDDDAGLIGAYYLINNN